VKFDISAEQKDVILKGVDYMEERTVHYMKVIMEDETFRGRTVGVGTMSKEQADVLGAVGPTARASGVERDVRVDSPYLAYPEFPVKLITDTQGDLHARFVVRLKELYESYRVIREILDRMPAGELETRVPRRIPAGEAIARVEAPRGELLYFLQSNGTDTPERVKVRTPSLCNWGTITSVAVGHKLADMPMLLVGIDPCFSCNDRLITVKRHNDSQEWTWEDLRQHGIEYYR
jgi:NADH-quinone oxidoreductase subunit D